MTDSPEQSQNPNSATQSTEFYRTQHKLRLSYMPWLYAELKPRHKLWAQAWQQQWQDYLRAVEDIQIGHNCFIAPEAKLFAEPGRTIVIGDNSYIAADAIIHGPVRIGINVSINHHVTMDGGSKGIDIGNHTRIAAYCQLYAFNHGLLTDRLVCEQPTHSQGINIGCDVWIGANVGIVDGVIMEDHSVAGMGSQVTRHVAAYKIVAGNPAQVIGDRRLK